MWWLSVVVVEVVVAMVVVVMTESVYCYKFLPKHKPLNGQRAQHYYISRLNTEHDKLHTE